MRCAGYISVAGSVDFYSQLPSNFRLANPRLVTSRSCSTALEHSLDFTYQSLHPVIAPHQPTTCSSSPSSPLSSSRPAPFLPRLSQTILLACAPSAPTQRSMRLPRRIQRRHDGRTKVLRVSAPHILTVPCSLCHAILRLSSSCSPCHPASQPTPLARPGRRRFASTAYVADDTRMTAAFLT